MKSYKNFSIKNRLYDLAAKALSLKSIWMIIVTNIYIFTDKVDTEWWILFILSTLGITAVNKNLYEIRSSKQKIIVGENPD